MVKSKYLTNEEESNDGKYININIICDWLSEINLVRTFQYFKKYNFKHTVSYNQLLIFAPSLFVLNH